MAIEINLATYDKQEEILSNLGGGVTFMYMLAKSDSTASQSDIEALKEIPHIKNIVNSEAAVRAVINSSTAMTAVANSSTAMTAVLNSSTAMTAVINSSTAMEALLNSKNTKTLTEEKTISGKFLPLKSNNNSKYLQAYNGTWSNIGAELGEWLLKNLSNPIATQIKYEWAGKIIHYYDLNA